MAAADILRKVFGTKHGRTIKKMGPLIAHINGLQSSYEGASDEELRGMTGVFREKLDNGAPLDDLLPDAFAVVREAAWRTLKMRHFDVQLVGGIILNRGEIAEMKTGEGKTLSATLPAYLNAIGGEGVHVVTVNDYLASRDAEWMGQIYRFLGMEVGTIIHGLKNDQRRASYACDITYGTNNEFGFDFLRDNMKLSLEHMVQRGHNFAIVDEVDSILIDEARTPLIISGSADRPIERYYEIDKIIPGLKQEIDYILDEENRSVTLTDEGIDRVEQRLGIGNLYLPENIETLHLVNQGLRAHTLYKRDRDYVVRDNKVTIVDPFTGRLMAGRRWSDGLHQAVEAKEKIQIEKESETLATITYQKYFLKYAKLSGMTGTADTEAAEFEKIYETTVTVIPTNKPIIRDDCDDVIYKTEPEKFEAVIAEIIEMRELGRPVLVGTASVEKSELLDRMMTKAGIPHNVLNAKHHQSEAGIIAQAGRPGTVTISTNMAGRGTDILLGGNPEALAQAELGPWNSEEESKEDYDRRLQSMREHHAEQCNADKQRILELGGLHVLGTERHESRRIDNQLRGRAGRQGDPGSSRFYLSLEDDLLRIFGSDRMKGMMERLGMEDGVPLEHPWLSKAVGNAQGKVEGRNFGIRKNLLEYDEVMSQQRDAVYGMRMQVINGEDTRELVLDSARHTILDFCHGHLPDQGGEQDLDVDGLNRVLTEQFKMPFELELEKIHGRDPTEIADEVLERVESWYNEKEELIGEENLRYRERYFLLNVTDGLWKSHLQAMDHLRGGIGLRGYGQRNPLLEYKKEGFEMFQMMCDLREQHILEQLFENLAHERALTDEEKAALLEEQERKARERAAAAAARANKLGGGQRTGRAQKPVTVRRDSAKVGRNDPCPCGSGKKYKKCHMLKDSAGGEAEAAPASA
ncbi:MAG: preprotein translocase subunit SecA [Deltaproteobacteria bacterium]|nr:preprotein translocase subunit SecA [Deltaproteobacteria bacterium]